MLEHAKLSTELHFSHISTVCEMKSSAHSIDEKFQHFHRMEKKISLEAWTLAEPMNVQIGQYKLDIADMRFPAGHKQISVKHLLY